MPRDKPSIASLVIAVCLFAACQSPPPVRHAPAGPEDVGNLTLPHEPEAVSPDETRIPPLALPHPHAREEAIIPAGSAVLPVVADTDIAGWPIGRRTLEGLTEHGKNRGAHPTIKIKRFENRPIIK